MHVEISLFILCAILLDLKHKLCWSTIIQVILEHAYDLVEFNSFFAPKDFLQFTVENDEASIIRVLQSVLLNVLPESSNYFRPRVFLNAEDLLQLLTQRESLRRLVEPKTDLNFEWRILLLHKVTRDSYTVEG